MVIDWRVEGDIISKGLKPFYTTGDQVSLSSKKSQSARTVRESHDHTEPLGDKV